MTALSLVADHMTRDPVTLRPEEEINGAIQTLLRHRISGAPVVGEGGALVGILTEKDGLRAALEASYYREWGKPVSAYMATEVATMDPGLDLLSACQTMLDGPHRRFPVVEDGRLCGMISRADILRGLAAGWG